MFQDASDLAAMAETLSQSTDYRVLRRLVPRPSSIPARGQETRTGILLDTETTGLDHARDEIIELGMVKFDYSADGRIVSLRDTFSAFNEPSAPIPPEVTALTGITDDMVAGHKIEEAAVNAFVDGAVISIAHNAGFRSQIRRAVLAGLRRHGLGLQRDRGRLAEARIRRRATRVPSERRRIFPPGPPGGRRLPRPAGDLGLHASCDGSAGARRPARDSTKNDDAYLGRAVAVRAQGFAEESGYRWNDGSDGRPKSWHIDVCETALDDELTFLRTEIYLRNVEPRLQTLTAFSRFSCRV
ncbi:DNA polymerase-3 subunit epsilon [Bradyrhizobium sp. S3.14.4]